MQCPVTSKAKEMTDYFFKQPKVVL